MILLLAALAFADPGEEAARLDRAHLTRLGAWAGASALGGGTLLLARPKDPGARGFAIQQIGWAAVNGVILGAAWGASGEPRSDAEIARNRELYAVNAGLDVGYVGVGLTLGAWGRKEKRPFLQGTGWGIAVQGAGLLVLDGVVWGQYPPAVP